MHFSREVSTKSDTIQFVAKSCSNWKICNQLSPIKKEDIFPQLEYPWREINVDSHKKVIRTPATDLELALEIDSIYSRKLNLIMKFASLLINDFDKITTQL